MRRNEMKRKIKRGGKGRSRNGPRFNIGSQAIRSLNRVNIFRLVDNNSTPLQQSSTAGGVLAGFQNADPSGGSGSTWTANEWANLTAMFSEVKLLEFSVSFMFVPPTLDSKITGDISNYFMVSGVLSSVAAAPTTSAQVHDNADARILQPFTHTTGRAFKHTIRPASPLNWAIVTTANPGGYAGCPGAIQWYSDQLVVSQVQMQIKMEGVYLFRSRI